MRPCPSVPFPQRQQIPQFGAVAAWLSSQHPFHRPSVRPCPSVPFPQRQQIPQFGAVAAWLSSQHPFHRPSVRPCPSVPFPQRQQIPRFGAVAESHSAWPLPQALSSYTLSSFHLLPPSEGAQISLFFVSPSEGAWSRHIFESALCPCFSSRRAFPTFRRCAVFPLFRPTFRRCAEASLLRERPVSVFLLRPCISHLPKVRRFPSFSSHLPKVCSFKMKRPDVLCRKTSIAITRILVFLPLFNRK